MRCIATVTSQGRVTIPVEVRRHLGLRRGVRGAFELVDGTVVLRPVADDPFSAYAGALADPADPDDEEGIRAWMRELRDPDA